MPYKYAEDKRRRDRQRYRERRTYYMEKAAVHRMENPELHAYWGQRHTSKQRGVEFKLTFEEWLEFWGDDLPNRGRKDRDLCMCRYDDAGAYEVGNIYIDTNARNKMGPKSKPEEAAECVTINR